VTEGEIATVQRRRRVRKEQRRPTRSWGAYLRSRDFARLVFAVMVVLSVGYFARYLWDTRMGAIVYSGLPVGVHERDVRYVLGKPNSVEGEGTLYHYTDKGSTVSVRLAESGQAASIKCTARSNDASSCAPFLDVPIGATEERVLRQLGGPSRVTYSGDDKVMHYDGLGVSFWLRKYQVYAIELRDRPSFMGALPEALWRMVP
jgi:hypothetical protein